jgi:hypothetical protein
MLGSSGSRTRSSLALRLLHTDRTSARGPAELPQTSGTGTPNSAAASKALEDRKRADRGAISAPRRQARPVQWEAQTDNGLAPRRESRRAEG